MPISSKNTTFSAFLLMLIIAGSLGNPARAKQVADEDSSTDCQQLRARIAELERENESLRIQLGQIAAPGIPADIDGAVLRSIQTRLAARWFHARAVLDAARAGRIDSRIGDDVIIEDGRAVFRNTTIKAAAISESKARLQSVEQSPYERPIGDEPLREGWIGYFNPLRIRQVVDGQSLIGEADTRAQWKLDVWVEMPTDGMVDGSQLRGRPAVDTTFIVIGRKQYDTAVGSTKTVWHARKIDWARYTQWLIDSGFRPTDRTTWPPEVIQAVSNPAP